MLNLEELLAPISDDQPCGEDLAFSPEVDAVNRARQADDPSIDQGAWVTTLKEADWKFVAKQCATLVAQRSKDLQLAVWLVEASAKTHGMRGLADSLFVLAELCDRFWGGLYPMLEDGVEQRIGNLSWIAARAPLLMLEMAVTEDGAFSMQRVAGANAAGAEESAALDTARRRSSRAFGAALVSDCELCEAALARLEAVIDARLQDDGPGLTAAKAALQTVLHFVRPLAGEPVVAAAPGVAVAAAPVGMAAEGPMQSRAQALAQLRAVADFFRRTEPHSPVAYLADKAAHWGEQPLHVWLRAVVKDDAAFAQFEDLLGLQSDAA
jgi:type VI secretion system protein ImpA